MLEVTLGINCRQASTDLFSGLERLLLLLSGLLKQLNIKIIIQKYIYDP